MSLKTKWWGLTAPVRAYLLWAMALAYLLLSATLYSYVKELFAERPPLWMILIGMCLIFYPSLRLIRGGAIYYWKRTTEQSGHSPETPQACNEDITPAEHRLYPILLMVRIGSVIALLMFVGLALYGKTFSIIADSVIGILVYVLVFFVLLDGLISYRLPRLAERIPANALLAYIFQSSLFSKSGENRPYILIILILMAVIFIALAAGRLA